MSESKYRITDLAKEFKTDKDTIIDILKSKNYKVKNMFSAVGEEERAAVKEELGRTAKPVRKESLQSKTPAPKAAGSIGEVGAACTDKCARHRDRAPGTGKDAHGGTGALLLIRHCRQPQCTPGRTLRNAACSRGHTAPPARVGTQ